MNANARELMKTTTVVTYDHDGSIINESCNYQAVKKAPNDKIEVSGGGSFVKVYRKMKPPYSQMTYFRYFRDLIEYIEFGTNVIAYAKSVHGRKRNFTKEDIASVLSVSQGQANRFIAESVSIGAFARVSLGKNSFFIVNPAYAINGRYFNIDHVGLFLSNFDFLMSLTNEDKKKLANFKNIFIGDEINEVKSRMSKEELAKRGNYYCLDERGNPLDKVDVIEV